MSNICHNTSRNSISRVSSLHRHLAGIRLQEQYDDSLRRAGQHQTSLTDPAEWGYATVSAALFCPEFRILHPRLASPGTERRGDSRTSRYRLFFHYPRSSFWKEIENFLRINSEFVLWNNLLIIPPCSFLVTGITIFKKSNIHVLISMILWAE